MEALVRYCNRMSYFKPAIHAVYIGGTAGEKSEAWIIATAARQINWDGSMKPEEMGELRITGYRKCTD